MLGAHLGPLLFQLPPNFQCDVRRLATFLGWLPADVRAGVRVPARLVADRRGVRAACRAHSVALCIADFGDKTTPVVPTARHGYFRLRDEGYQAADLERWADLVVARAADWDDVFVYFKHEDEGKGPEFARAFAEILANKWPGELEKVTRPFIRWHGGGEKVHGRPLGPVVVLARGVDDEPAVAAVFGDVHVTSGLSRTAGCGTDRRARTGRPRP